MLVHIDKIFPLSEQDSEAICTAFTPRLSEPWFCYDELCEEDRAVLYEPDNGDTSLVFVSLCGNPYNWTWLYGAESPVEMVDYGFCDNGSQTVRRAAETMKNDNRDYCIALVPFETSNDYDDKFYYRNGDYIGSMPHEDTNYETHTLEDVTIPDRVKIMFHFYILARKQ